MDPDVQLNSQDSVYLLAKATEMFISFLSQEAHLYTKQNKKKILSKQDVEAAIENVDCLAFLESGLLNLEFKSLIDGNTVEPSTPSSDQN